MNDTLHVIYCPFSVVGTGTASLDPSWFPRRTYLFEQYTLKSLLNQTNHDFVLWMAFRPQDRTQALELKQKLDTLDLKTVFTFDGLAYWDDKFSRRPWIRLKNVARVLRAAYRLRDPRIVPKAVLSLWEDRNGTLETRLGRMLPEFEPMCTPATRWVIMTRLDSDDMLHGESIAEIQAMERFQGAYTYRRGYALNMKTGELAEWLPPTNPPFHTICFPVQDFFNPDRHVAYYGSFTSHEDIPYVFNTKALPDWHYCVLVHDPKLHISGTWSHPFRGATIDEPELILKTFGL